MTSRILVSVVAAAGALALSACSPSNQADSDLPPGSEPDVEITEPSGAEHGEECTAKDFKVTGDEGAKPAITIPHDCAAPTKLLTVDLTEGEGAEIAEGSSADMHYLLVTFSEGAEADNSFDRGEPFPLENIGQAAVIDGWNQGLIGMKEGGRRLLVVPSDLGYGDQGSGAIKPGETLVFVVDAVKVTA